MEQIYLWLGLNLEVNQTLGRPRVYLRLDLWVGSGKPRGKVKDKPQGIHRGNPRIISRVKPIT